MKMKALIIAGALVLSTVSAHAGSYCKELGKVAATVMIARQTGVPMSTLIEASYKAATPEMMKLGQAIVIAAYSVPFYQTASNKQEAVNGFVEGVEFTCYTNGGR